MTDLKTIVKFAKRDPASLGRHRQRNVAFTAENPPTVYVIESQGKFKIGHTSCLKSRLAQLQMSTPFLLRVVFSEATEAARFVEQWLHVFFASQHVCGEWYSLSQDDLELIQGLGVDGLLLLLEAEHAVTLPDGV